MYIRSVYVSYFFFPYRDDNGIYSILYFICLHSVDTFSGQYMYVFGEKNWLPLSNYVFTFPNNLFPVPHSQNVSMLMTPVFEEWVISGTNC